MPCRQIHHQRRVSCSSCAALMLEYAALRRRVELLQRQLRATANLQQLLAAKDRELAACRARLEQLGDRQGDVEEHEGLTDAKSYCVDDIEEDGQTTTNSDRQLDADSADVLRPPTITGCRRSTTDDWTQTTDVDQKQRSYRFQWNSETESVNPPPRCLTSKLMDQNTRLKNMVRQFIAERGLTVTQYLEEQERRDVLMQHLLRRLNVRIITSRPSPASATGDNFMSTTDHL